MFEFMGTKRPCVPLAAALAIAGASLAFASSSASAQAVSDVYQPINCDFNAIACIDVGESRLLRTDSGISINIVTTDLREGHAYTVWWVVFNNPEACAGYPGPCGLADLGDPDVNATVQWGTGDVAVGTAGGVAKKVNKKAGASSGVALSLVAHLNEGETTPGGPLFDLPGDDDGLEDAFEAEVHAIVRSHGPGVANALNDQITSFGGGCVVDVGDELPEGVPDEPRVPEQVGECGDIQFAVHQPAHDDDDDYDDEDDD